MKKISLVFFFLLIISCVNDVKVGNTETKLVLGKTAVTLSEGKTEKVLIKQGNAPFKLKTSNDNVNASVGGRIINITAVKTGNSVVQVFDSKSNKATIRVAVIDGAKSIKLHYSDINIDQNKKYEIKIINGSGDYAVEVDTKNVEAKVIGESLFVTGNNLGNSVVTITDNTTKKTTSVKVLVKNSIDLKISEEQFITYKGKKQIRVYNGLSKDIKLVSKTIAIESGSKAYEVYVKSKDNGDRLVKATLVDGKLKIRSIEGIHRAYGNATVVLRDELTGQRKEILVNVVKPLKLNEGDITVRLNKKTNLIKFENHPIVKAESCNECLVEHINVSAKNTSIALAEKSSNDNFNGFTVEGKKLGTTSVVISDGVKNVEINVNVIKNILPVKIGDITVSLNDVIQIKEGESTVLAITGSGDFNKTYTPSDLIKEESFESGTVSKLTLKALKEGEVAVAITDNNSGEKVNFTLKIVKDNVYNCDPNGKFKYTIDYGDASHDSTQIDVTSLKQNDSAGNKKVYNCEETITMKVDDIVTFKLCGGSPDHPYSLSFQEAIVGNKREVLKLFDSSVRLNTSSTVTALSKGEVIIYIKGYDKIDGKLEETLKHFRIVVK